MFRENRIFKNMKSGVRVSEKGVCWRLVILFLEKRFDTALSGKGLLVQSEIYENEMSGILIMLGGDPIVRNCLIRDNHGDGVCVTNDGLGTLETNDIAANHKAGIAVEQGSDPKILLLNKVHHSGGVGIFFNDSCRGTADGNHIFENSKSGVTVSAAANPTIVRNKIFSGHSHGVMVYRFSTSSFFCHRNFRVANERK